MTQYRMTAPHKYILIYILVLCVALIGCHEGETPRTIQDKSIDTISHECYSREFGEAAIDYMEFEQYNLNLYILSDTNPNQTLKLADSLLKSFANDYKSTGKTINLNKISDLHFLKGEIFYKQAKYKEAVREFSFDTLTDIALGRAAALVKLSDFENAHKDLLYRVDFYFGHRMELANYFEIVGNIDSARIMYNQLWERDWVRGSNNYAQIPIRLKELNKKNPKLLKELEMPTRRPSQ